MIIANAVYVSMRIGRAKIVPVRISSNSVLQMVSFFRFISAIKLSSYL